ncbi:LysE family translocator [Curvibacter sp. CHRR-16]|uniref:LysE family translocator n=1 Tax=Curvibacter sp. CHRR-16 TaxID=2835872 RepID=UPI001BD97E47|nr:LysE family translocator [Curvibacter sp. CHRR-16]MBT0570464.1 LysE family translocator [Curvibacter sp. CHRR-16]
MPTLPPLSSTLVTASALLPFLTYCMVMSITPGPNNVLLTNTGAQFGYRRAVPQILGNCTGVALLTLLCCLGLGQLFVLYPWLQTGLRVGGTLYLLYLAYQLSRATLQAGRAVQPLSFWQGLGFQAINPKSWVRAVTVATVFTPSDMGLLPATLLLSSLGFAVGFPCTSVWALFGTLLRQQLQEPRKQRWFNALMAALLVWLAIGFWW